MLFRSLQQALADLTNKTTDEVDKLTKAKLALNAAELRGGLGAEYDKQIAKVKELAAAETERLAGLVDGLSKAKALEEFRLYAIKQQQDNEDKLLGIQREIADIGLTDIEKKYRDISRAADDSAKAAIRDRHPRSHSTDPTPIRLQAPCAENDLMFRPEGSDLQFAIGLAA